jgi:4-hydroxybenzoate polyprenyltransferase
MALMAALLLLGYSLFGKRLVVIANIGIAGVSAFSFAYAAAVGENWNWSQVRFVVLAIVLVFLYHLGREIVKDIADEPGDSAQGVRTVPTVVGASASKIAAIIVFGLMIVAILLAYMLYRLSVMYLVSSAVLLVIPMIAILWRFARSSGQEGFRATERMLKMLMPFGLTILLIARYTV